jgi:hypothetical protein
MKNTDGFYDVVTCVGPLDRSFSHLSLRYILANTTCRSIYVIAPQKILNSINNFDQKVVLVDETDVIPDLTSKDIARYLSQVRPSNIFDTNRFAKCYFQQFLKMGICNRSDLGENYLIWDSDTILLRPLTFFSEDGKTLFMKGNEYHAPYFATLKRVLKETRQVDFSFIAQHMMINKRIMAEMINKIKAESLFDGSWVWTILKAIFEDNNSSSASYSSPIPEFSEYETYGNYITNNYPEMVEYRELPWLINRGGGHIDHFPAIQDLDTFAKSYAFVAFETRYPFTSAEKIVYHSKQILRSVGVEKLLKLLLR